MKDKVKVGDILYGMWHYSMHFPVFFRVTKVTAKTATAEQLFSKCVRATDGGYGQQGYEAPDIERGVWSDGHIIRDGKRGLETGSYAKYNHYNLQKWDSPRGWLLLSLVAVFIITNFIDNEQRKKEKD